MQVTHDTLPNAVEVLLREVDALKQLVQENNSPKEQEDELLLVGPAAKLANVAESTMRVLAQKRKVPHYKSGGKLLFSKTELINWLKSGKRKTYAEVSEEADSFLKKKGAATV